MPKIRVDEKTAKVLDKLKKLETKTPEGKMEYKMAELEEPVTLTELSKKVRRNKKETFKILSKLIKSHVISVSLTKAEKFLR